MKRWLRWPPLHFVVGGALLLAMRLVVIDGSPLAESPERDAIVITQAHIDRLRAGFARRFGAAPTSEQLRGLVDEQIQEEILYREAKRLAQDHDDPSVRHRLLQKMRAVTADPGQSDDALVRAATALGLDEDVVIRRLLVEEMRLLLRRTPGPDELSSADAREILDRHRDEFLQPERVTFAQVFLSADLRGAALDADAARVADALASHASPVTLSDPFPLGLDFRAVSRLRLQGRLGKPFVDAIFALEPGRWSGPIRSPYGLHFVRIDATIPPELPEAHEVRSRLLQIAAAERGAARLAEGLNRLQARYDIRVEATLPGSSTHG